MGIRYADVAEMDAAEMKVIVMDEREKQIDELAKMTLYRVINGRRCLRSGHCKHCGAHKAATNPLYIKCDCYRMAEKIFDAGYRMLEECENVSRWRGAYECSVCHWDCDEADNGETEYKFCPGCGRKVKEKE